MGSRTVERTFVLGADPATVHAWMTDPERLPELHPLIDRVAITSRGDDHVAFDVFERVPFLGLRVPNRYRAENRWKGTEELDLSGTAAIGVEVRQIWKLRAVPGGTEVHQTATVSAPWPLLGFTVATANQAHAALVERLIARLTAR
jgi:Polyketide cyclase / dehydrase and lipid transport